MKIRGRIDVAAALLWHLAQRVETLIDKWDEEARECTLAGNPKRAFYLEYMAGRAPEIVQERVETYRKERADFYSYTPKRGLRADVARTS